MSFHSVSAALIDHNKLCAYTRISLRVSLGISSSLEPFGSSDIREGGAGVSQTRGGHTPPTPGCGTDLGELIIAMKKWTPNKESDATGSGYVRQYN